MFKPTSRTGFINRRSLLIVDLSSAFHFGLCFVCVVLMLLACSNTEVNPGTKKELFLQFLSVPLDLNGLTAQNFY